ncbi:MAG: nucleotidyltransferase family protein [Pseudomonadota bacterium]
MSADARPAHLTEAALSGLSKGLDTGMVLAAGLGSRMRPLTEHKPKPLLEVAGRSLFDRSLDRLGEVGVSRVVANLHYLPEQIREHWAAHPHSGMALAFSDESARLLDTGGGVRAALPLLDRPAFYTINGDNVWTAPEALGPLAGAWDPARMDALLLLVPIERTHGYTRAGDFSVDAAGRLVRRGAAARAPLVYTGAQVLSAGAFADAPEAPFSLNLVWDRLIASGRAFGCVCAGDWVDVGTPEGLQLATDLVSHSVECSTY